MNNQNLSDLTLDQLKVKAYDTLAALEMHQRELGAINAELKNRYEIQNIQPKGNPENSKQERTESGPKEKQAEENK